MKHNFLLSIIIPVYNGEKYIKECLDSIFENDQKLFEFEVLIINDGSNDNSEGIIKSYMEKHSCITYIKNENHGVSYTRNTGIEKAQGKYITFVDCDDVLTSNWQEKLECMKSKKFDVILFSKHFIETTSTWDKNKILTYVLTYNDENIRISGPYSKLFSREYLVKKNIKFNELLINAEDMLFSFEVVLKTDSYFLIKDSYYKVRHNSFSTTRMFNEYIIKSEKEFLNAINNAIDSSNLSKKDIIKTNCICNSLRTILYRLSFVNKYKYAKKYYKIVKSEEVFKKFYEEFKFNKKRFRNSIILYMFKYNLFFLIYTLLKIKHRWNSKDYFELL